MGKTKTQIHGYFNQNGFNKMKCAFCGWTTATNATRMFKHIKTQCKLCPQLAKNEVISKKSTDNVTKTEISLENCEVLDLKNLPSATCSNTSNILTELVASIETPNDKSVIEHSKKLKLQTEDSYSSAETEESENEEEEDLYHEDPLVVEDKSKKTIPKKRKRNDSTENEHILYAKYIATQFKKLPLASYENMKIKIQTMLSEEIVANGRQHYR